MPEFRVVFTAEDYDTTVPFFTDVMGLEVLRSWDDHGRGTILLAADGQIEVFDNPDGGPTGVSGVHLAWEVADADAEYEALAARGASLHGPPQMQPWGHRNFTVDAPDGWTITLFEVVVPQ